MIPGPEVGVVLRISVSALQQSADEVADFHPHFIFLLTGPVHLAHRDKELQLIGLEAR